MTADGWTADKMNKSFLRMTAHWIGVKIETLKTGKTRQDWTLQNAVVGFQRIAGGHDGQNEGRYFMGITDHAGITEKNESKVSPTHSPLID